MPSAPVITQVIDDVVPEGQPPQSIPNGGVTNDWEPDIRISLTPRAPIPSGRTT